MSEYLFVVRDYTQGLQCYTHSHGSQLSSIDHDRARLKCGARRNNGGNWQQLLKWTFFGGSISPRGDAGPTPRTRA